MLSQGFSVLLCLAGFLAVLIFYGMATDPSRHKPKTKRAKVAEDFIDLLDRGGPR